MEGVLNALEVRWRVTAGDPMEERNSDFRVAVEVWLARAEPRADSDPTLVSTLRRVVSNLDQGMSGPEAIEAARSS